MIIIHFLKFFLTCKKIIALFKILGLIYVIFTLDIVKNLRMRIRVLYLAIGTGLGISSHYSYRQYKP